MPSDNHYARQRRMVIPRTVDVKIDGGFRCPHCNSMDVTVRGNYKGARYLRCFDCGKKFKR